MEHEIDLDCWPRRESYDFFKSFADPFVGVQVDLDITGLVRACRTNDWSIHHALLFITLKAANSYDPMRLRRKEDGVVLHQNIDLGCSVLREDGETFTFANYTWNPEETTDQFISRATVITQRAAKGLPLDPRSGRTNLIYGTTLPWLTFTSFKHPKKNNDDSIPRIVFGRFFERDGRFLLPYNLEVDHALMDGLHISRFFELLGIEVNYF
tara:strand:+ start:297 stop:929 length:633 start_codon:yes stop_codon:yes gene_type:complete